MVPVTVVIPENVAAAPTILLTEISGVPLKPAAFPVVSWFSVGILATLKVPDVILDAARLGI